MYKKKAITEKNAIIKAQNLCAEREKCESDIRKKLYDWKLPVKNHDTVIDRLIQDKFIDEKRFAISFAKDKFRYNKWGKIKIEFALKQKQINGAVIKIALDEIDESEYDTLLENDLIKKNNTIKDTDEYTIKSKLIRFASSRGFENGKVFDKVSSIIEMRKK